jgi:hypothetical protein
MGFIDWLDVWLTKRNDVFDDKGWIRNFALGDQASGDFNRVAAIWHKREMMGSFDIKLAETGVKVGFFGIHLIARAVNTRQVVKLTRTYAISY